MGECHRKCNIWFLMLSLKTVDVIYLKIVKVGIGNIKISYHLIQFEILGSLYPLWPNRFHIALWWLTNRREGGNRARPNERRRREKSEEQCLRKAQRESERRLRLLREFGDRHPAASLAASSVDHGVLVYGLRETHHVEDSQSRRLLNSNCDSVRAVEINLILT